jgi:hypothetical protein
MEKKNQAESEEGSWGAIEGGKIGMKLRISRTAIGVSSVLRDKVD